MVINLKLQLRQGVKNLVDLYQGLAEAEGVWYEDYPILTGASDESVSLGPITTADVFYISSDVAVTYKVNAGTTSHTLDANGYHLAFGTAVTALTITNSSGYTAYLKIGFWGA